MQILVWAAMLAAPPLTFVYTWSYARRLWERKQKRGAAGLALLALAAVVLPYYMIFFRD
jgi:hypothetical protein